MTLNQLIDVACSIGWLMILLPSIVYLGTEWRSRRARLNEALNDKALLLYFRQFFPSKKIIDARKQFGQEFGRLYGIRQYILPLILLAILAGVGMWMTSMTVKSWLGQVTFTYTLPAIVIAAYLGAYAWVLVDQLTRYQRRDFTKHNIYDAIYRLLIAVPLGFSFAALFQTNVGVAIAFLLGAFPTQTLLKFSRRLVVERLGLGEKEPEGPTELAKLQGIGRENAERFQNVDITTIVQLAWADPIDLMIRTNLEFSFVIDAISQALTWIYFEEDTRKLYRYLLRGSQEIRWLLNRLANERTKPEAEQTLKSAAALMQMDETSFLHTLRAISEDPYTEFIVSIWSPVSRNAAVLLQSPQSQPSVLVRPSEQET